MCSELQQGSWELSEMQGGLRRLKCCLGCLETAELVESEHPPDAYSFIKHGVYSFIQSAVRFKSCRVGVMRGRDKESDSAAVDDSVSLES